MFNSVIGCAHLLKDPDLATRMFGELWPQGHAGNAGWTVYWDGQWPPPAAEKVTAVSLGTHRRWHERLEACNRIVMSGHETWYGEPSYTDRVDCARYGTADGSGSAVRPYGRARLRSVWTTHFESIVVFLDKIDPTRAGSADLHGFLSPPRSVSMVESYKNADTRNRMADCAMPHNLEISSRIHKILIENGDVRKEWVAMVIEWAGAVEACALRTVSVQVAGSG